MLFRVAQVEIPVAAQGPMVQEIPVPRRVVRVHLQTLVVPEVEEDKVESGLTQPQQVVAGVEEERQLAAPVVREILVRRPTRLLLTVFL